MAIALEQMYKEIILEHQARPRNKGKLQTATRAELGENPSCGDRIEIQLLLQDGVIRDIRFDGMGCSISQASASMMTQLVMGKNADQVLVLVKHFHDMLQGQTADESLGDAVALVGVSKLHARVKCATLAWQTLELALGKSKDSELDAK